jgi:hypothetical protein
MDKMKSFIQILYFIKVSVVYKATNEIHHKLDGDNSQENPEKKPKVSTLQS